MFPLRLIQVWLIAAITVKDVRIPHGAPGGMRAVPLKGTKSDQCSFVTIAAAVSTSGLPSLSREMNRLAIGEMGVGSTHSAAVFECTVTHVPPCPIAVDAGSLPRVEKYCV
jgi:hypothetical protein